MNQRSLMNAISVEDFESIASEKTAEEYEREVAMIDQQLTHFKTQASNAAKRKRDDDTAKAHKAALISNINSRIINLRTEHSTLTKRRMDLSIINDNNPINHYPDRETIRTDHPRWRRNDVEDEYYELKENYYNEIDRRSKVMRNLEKEIQTRATDIGICSTHLAEFVPAKITTNYPSHDISAISSYIKNLNPTTTQLRIVPANIPLFDPTKLFKSDIKRKVAHDVTSFIELYNRFIKANGGTNAEWLRWFSECLPANTQLELPSTFDEILDSNAPDHVFEEKKIQYQRWLRLQHEGANYLLNNSRYLESLKMNQSGFENESGRGYTTRYKRALKNTDPSTQEMSDIKNIGRYVYSLDTELKNHCLNTRGLRTFMNIESVFEEVQNYCDNKFGFPSEINPEISTHRKILQPITNVIISI